MKTFLHILLFFILVSNAYSAETQLLAKSTMNVDSFGVCKKLENTTSINYYVPNGTSHDWSSFLDHLPAGVTASSCIVPICLAATITNCDLVDTPSGSSAGACSTGYDGTCSFGCLNKVWSANSNTCIASATPQNTSPTGYGHCPSAYSVYKGGSSSSCGGLGCDFGTEYKFDHTTGIGTRRTQSSCATTAITTQQYVWNATTHQWDFVKTISTSGGQARSCMQAC